MTGLNVVGYEERLTVNHDEFNAFCTTLRATTYSIWWGGSHVWKVGGKLFAGGGGDDAEPSFAFKVSGVAYDVLRAQPGLRPAPYFALRSLNWIQHFAKPGLSDDELRGYFRHSHILVASGLPTKEWRQFGFGVGKREPLVST